MHRFYLPPEQCQERTIFLRDSEAHHAAKVLRLQPGERVIVLDGIGRELLSEVVHVAKGSVQLAVIEKKIHAPPPCQITLLQAIPKGRMFEWIIEKATELGTARIVPLLTERVITRLNSDEGDAKREKWQQVAIEAIKQCGQPWLPKIETPSTPREFLAREEKFDLALAGSLQEDSRPPRKFFRRFLEANNRAPKSVAIWIGPEGDFTSDEMELIKSAGAAPITLGKLVLRCETAAMYCLSIVNYELQSSLK